MQSRDFKSLSKMQTLLLGGLLLTLAYWLYKVTSKPAKFPPGPPKLPLVGSATYVHPPDKPKDVLVANQNLAKKYGGVAGYFLGSQPFIVISDFEVMKEVFRTEEASARPLVPLMNEPRPTGMKDGTTGGVIISSGRVWVEQRRFSLRHLRDLGFGKTSMAESLLEEINALSNLLRKYSDKPVTLHRTVNISVVGALWKMLVGESFEDLEDPGLAEVVRVVDESLKEQPKALSLLSQSLPFSIASLPIIDKITGYKDRKDLMTLLQGLVSPYVEEHKKTMIEGEPRDFVDIYLSHVKSTKDTESSFWGSGGYKQLQDVIIDLFMAGTDTTSTSIVWAILYLMHHPEIQTRVQEELDACYGPSALPDFSGSKKELPYTNAVISEIFRKTSLAHNGLPHRASAEVDLGNGMVAPANSLIWANLYGVHHDPTYWKDPDCFNPNRFLDDEGNFVPDERVVPFGVGKRVCLGQTLAEKEFFLFFTCLVKQFNFRRVPGETLPGYGLGVYPAAGVVRECPPYRVLISDRV